MMTLSDNQLVLPGYLITDDEQYMCGKGTYMRNGAIYAAQAGFVEVVGKILMLRPLKTRYNGDLGDVVIGRVIEISNKMWIMDIQSFDKAQLHINSIMLEDIQVG